MAHASDAVEVYRRYGPALLRKAERILLNPDDAGDIVQGLFADLIKRGNCNEAELPYLYRAVTNRCLNLIRDRKRRAALLEREQTTLTPPPRTRCDDKILSLEFVTRLTQRLDKKSAEILIYRFVDDLTQEEIAELLGTSRKTVGKRLKKIRREVETLVAEANGGAA